jgi:hypothetical protein
VPAPNFLFMPKLPRPSLSHHHSYGAHRLVSLQLFHSGQICRPWRRLYASQHTGQLWIPKEDKSLQNRRCVVAHTGVGGYRGTKATLQTRRYVCKWAGMEVDVDYFVRSCLNCIATSIGYVMPRWDIRCIPMNQTLYCLWTTSICDVVIQGRLTF